MARLTSAEDLPGNRIKRTYDDGRVQIVDALTGKLLPGGRLPAEAASVMGKRGAAVRGSAEASVEQLLFEAGYDDDNPAPAYVKLMADQAVKNHTAMLHWRKLTASDPVVDGGPAEARPAEGNVCPTCGMMYMPALDTDLVRQVLDVLRAVERENASADDLDSPG